MEIQGHEVEFADTLPAGTWWGLFPKLAQIEPGDKLIEKLEWDTVRTLLAGTVTAWDLDADPSTPEAYDSLDFMFAQALCAEVYAHVIGLFLDAQPGTQAKKST